MNNFVQVSTNQHLLASKVRKNKRKMTSNEVLFDDMIFASVSVETFERVIRAFDLSSPNT